MTIFDIISGIIYSKTSAPMANLDDEPAFNSYMVNRWLSMYSPELANFVNETTNKYSTIFDSRKELFDFYVSIFPKTEFKKIDYIKKAVKEKDKTNISGLVAKSRELSVREIEMYNQLVDILD